jgi:hypothetical protein
MVTTVLQNRSVTISATVIGRLGTTNKNKTQAKAQPCFATDRRQRWQRVEDTSDLEVYTTTNNNK